MHSILQTINRIWYAETSLLISVFSMAALLLTFGFIADEVMEGATSAFDQYVILAFRSAADNFSNPIGPPWVKEMARDVTSLGSIVVLGMVLLAAVGYLLISGWRTAALLLLFAVLGGEAMNSLLKFEFARPRPNLFLPAAKVFTPSFPSGHATLSAITYLTIAALLARTIVSRGLKIYLLAVGVTLTFLVGVSRVYLGVHYPTDVLAGWCVGSAWALGCWAIMTYLQRSGQIVQEADKLDVRV